MRVKETIAVLKKSMYFMSVIKKMDRNITKLTYLNALICAIQPYITYVFLGIAIDYALVKRWTAALFIAVMMLAVGMILNVSSSWLKNRIEAKRQILYTTFKVDLHMHYLNLDYNTAEKFETVNGITKANSMVDMYGGLEELIGQLGGIIEALLSLCIATAMLVEFIIRTVIQNSMGFVERILLISVILGVIVTYLAVIVRDTKIYNINSAKNLKKHGQNEHALSYFLDHIYSDHDMIRDIKLYNMERLVQKKFDDFLHSSSGNYMESRDISIKHQLNSCLYACIYNLFAFILLIWQISAENITAGMFTRYYSSLLNLSQMTSRLVSDFGELKQTCNYLKPFEDFMQIPIQKSQDTGIDFGRNIGEIRLHNVSYKYPGASEYSLKNVSCVFKKGENTAIVGKNGAGKSTMVKLICGLYKPTSGSITVDGIDMEKLDLETKKQIFGAVFQECVVFPFSIGENIVCGSERNDNLLWHCIEKVGLKEKIENLPQRLETSLDCTREDSFELSGGEAQKLVIARAMYRDGGCMVLDEPASALDAVSENKLYELFAQLTADKIGILVSHRMSSCTFCDSIIVLDQGRIQGIGTHSGLLKTNDLYKSLWEAQARYYNS